MFLVNSTNRSWQILTLVSGKTIILKRSGTSRAIRSQLERDWRRKTNQHIFPRWSEFLRGCWLKIFSIKTVLCSQKASWPTSTKLLSFSDTNQLSFSRWADNLVQPFFLFLTPQFQSGCCCCWCSSWWLRLWLCVMRVKKTCICERECVCVWAWGWVHVHVNEC